MRHGLLLAALILTAVAHSQTQTAGAAAAWEKIQKLRTAVSVMHITAHPDDEHGGVLAKLSRGDGARVTMLTLTRGEAGDNAIGPELFDALGLIRTDELLAANRHYGVDQQYFTTAVDYGFSKRLAEALEKWDAASLLRDVVRIVRMERPTIILSRFQGSDRDGHGQHQAAGVMARRVFESAGDPNAYPEQIAEGLRPWRPAKLYFGGVRENEDWTVRINTGERDERLGDSYENIARRGLSLQRSQNQGRFTPAGSPNWIYYRALGNAAKEESIFDGLPRTLGEVIGPAGRAIDTAVSTGMLPQGLKLTRTAMAETADPNVRHLLAIKEQQFQDAINASLGVKLAVTTSVTSAVPGQPFRVDLQVEGVRGQVELAVEPGWTLTPDRNGFLVTAADATTIGTKAYFSRRGLHENRYALESQFHFGRPFRREPLIARVAYLADGVLVLHETPIDPRPLPDLSIKADLAAATKDVTTVPGLKVGYVMGIGDRIPEMLPHLRAEVTLLGEQELASADLSRFDTIVTGTRAYAVREDLKTHHARLLDYVKAGGNMIVLYNTQEFVPNTFAPFPGELPRTAEEVSEENSPVTILAPTHQAFTWPNKITAADFDGWVEQRGSKFFTKWDAAYTPMISTFDTGQAPQQGGWLTVKVGKGNWTYFAYSLHRQLPFGVPGAYRIAANLLALGKPRP